MSGTTSGVALPYPPDDPELVAAAADRCARLAAVAAAVADELARDAGRLAAAWSGPAASAAGPSCARPPALVGSLAEPLHRSAAGLRAHGRGAAHGAGRGRPAAPAYDERVAAHRRDLTALLSDGSWPGPVRRLQAADLLAAQQLELASLHRRHQDVLDRVAAHARATARRIGGRGRVGRAGAVRRARRSRTARPGSRPCCRCWPRAAGRPASDPVRPPPAGTAAGAGPAVVGGAHLRRAGPGRRDLAGRAGRAGRAARRGAQHRQRAPARPGRRRVATAAEPDAGNSVAGWATAWWCGSSSRRRGRRTGPGQRVAQLLVFDPTAFGYEGRAAIAVGDVDTADNVAFLVPGLGSDVLDSTASLTGTALRVETEAHRVAPTETTATVAWLGYDSPGGLVGGISDDAAEDGAEPARRRPAGRAGGASWCARTSPWWRTRTAARPPALALRDTADRDRRRGAGRQPRCRGRPRRGPRRPGRPRLRRRQQPRPGQLRRPVRRGPGVRVVRGGPVRGRGRRPGRGTSSFGDHSTYFDPALRVAGQHRARRDRRLRRSGARGLP